MKSSIKLMLLGIALILLGIFLRTVGIEHLVPNFIEFLMWALAVGGLIITLLGFFSEDQGE